MIQKIRWKRFKAWLRAIGARWYRFLSWADHVIGKVSSLFLYVMALIIVVSVLTLLISRRLPEQGMFSPPNVVFLGFILIFGLVGMSARMKARVWSAFGLAAGLFVWGLSVYFV